MTTTKQEPITDADLWAHTQKLTSSLGRQANPEDIWDDAKSNAFSPWNAIIPWDVEASVAVRSYQLDAIRQKYSTIQVKVTRREIAIRGIGYDSDPMVMRDPGKAGSESGYVAISDLMDDPGRAARSAAFDAQRALALLERTERRAAIAGLGEKYDAAQSALGIYLQAASFAGKKAAAAA